MELKLIRINSQGPLVTSWQFFLIGQHLYAGVADGIFSRDVLNATIEFQRRNNLQPDGIVGNKTYGVAMQFGFDGTIDDRTDKSGADYPKPPSFQPLVSNEERAKVFGKFSYVSQPVAGNPENIRVTDNWVGENIVTATVPQLVNIKGSDRVQFHKIAASQLVKLWADWEKAGLLPLVLTWGGSYVPRFIRGSRTTLSNHSFGSAFDINVAWNPLGAIPALVGQKGSVRELVQIANLNGFYWGGHFSRKDGMHFEVAQIK
ncbi:M15 family metallopeptidase [Chitinophaga ginsengisoli]|uniref:Putative peptidoglycan binding protein n=1 Tax=Chitinophaga ginsengisoli TaxID=363837 RepID=A0A2P8G310_9BACT|nr:M15 family metallopeptidase [Chitinophaga ginsengisoli]PSL28265.1 putative peptidoglycan binding protein [Chitinophaga ginsengisoli]